MDIIIFVLLALVTLASAVFMVVEKNPVYSVLYLVVTMLALAGFYATLGAGFLAAIQVIVYAGAIMVLFLFVVMLLDLRRGSGDRHFPHQGVIAGGLMGVLLVAVGLTLFTGQTAPLAREVTVLPAAGGNIEQMGRLLFGPWLYPLEIGGVLLLAAMIGTVVLAKR